MALLRLLSEFNFLMKLVNLVSLVGTDLELLSFRHIQLGCLQRGHFPRGQHSPRFFRLLRSWRFSASCRDYSSDSECFYALDTGPGYKMPI